MWGRDFDWYHFRPPTPTQTPQLGGGVELGGGGSKLDTGIAAQRRPIEQNFVLKDFQLAKLSSYCSL